MEPCLFQSSEAYRAGRQDYALGECISSTSEAGRPRALLRSAGPSLQAACKPNSVEDGHSSRRRIAAALKQPTRRFPLHFAGKPASLENPRWRAGQARRAAIWVWLRIPPYLVLLRVGFTLPPTLPPGRCALTAPFHPYLAPCGVGGIFSVALAVSEP